MKTKSNANQLLEKISMKFNAVEIELNEELLKLFTLLKKKQIENKELTTLEHKEVLEKFRLK